MAVTPERCAFCEIVAHLFLVPTRTGDLLDGFFNALERFQESPERLVALKNRRSLEDAAKKIRD